PPPLHPLHFPYTTLFRSVRFIIFRIDNDRRHVFQTERTSSITTMSGIRVIADNRKAFGFHPVGRLVLIHSGSSFTLLVYHCSTPIPIVLRFHYEHIIFVPFYIRTPRCFEIDMYL